jgi:hypothetical protein
VVDALLISHTTPAPVTAAVVEAYCVLEHRGRAIGRPRRRAFVARRWYCNLLLTQTSPSSTCSLTLFDALAPRRSHAFLSLNLTATTIDCTYCTPSPIIYCSSRPHQHLHTCSSCVPHERLLRHRIPQRHHLLIFFASLPEQAQDLGASTLVITSGFSSHSF